MYEKPLIKKIQLKPEEAVLTACKSGYPIGGGGPGSGCLQIDWFGTPINLACSTPGS